MSPLGWEAMIAANTALGFIGSVGGHLIQGHNLFGANDSEYWTDIGVSTFIGLGIGIIGGPGAQLGMNIKALQLNRKLLNILAGLRIMMSRVRAMRMLMVLLI